MSVPPPARIEEIFSMTARLSVSGVMGTAQDPAASKVTTPT